ncbi:MAG: F0F1 ATP synthase subunit epsilon [Lysobacterales bacterium]
MSRLLSLIITTPLEVVLQADEVDSLRAEDASGSFGILPGHTRLLTVLGASVLRWRRADGVWHYCALRGGVFSVVDGRHVRVACREAVTGDDLAALEQLVTTQMAVRHEAMRAARAEHTRLQAQAIRSLMQRLAAKPGSDALAEHFQ